MPSDAVLELLEQMRRQGQAALDMLIANLQAAATWPREAAVEFPFLTVDAALHRFLSQPEEPLRYRRQAQSAGSAIYTLRLGTTIVGSIRIRAVLNTSTHIALEIAAAVDKMEGFQKTYLTGYLPGHLWAFVEGLYKDEHDMKELDKATETFLVETSPVIAPRMPPEIENTSMRSSKPPGKKTPDEDDWAWKQVNELKRPKADVYKEWLQKTPPDRVLQDKKRSFRHAINPDRKRRNID